MRPIPFILWLFGFCVSTSFIAILVEVKPEWNYWPIIAVLSVQAVAVIFELLYWIYKRDKAYSERRKHIPEMEAQRMVALKYGYNNWAELKGDANEGHMDMKTYFNREREVQQLISRNS